MKIRRGFKCGVATFALVVDLVGKVLDRPAFGMPARSVVIVDAEVVSDDYGVVCGVLVFEIVDIFGNAETEILGWEDVAGLGTFSKPIVHQVREVVSLDKFEWFDVGDSLDNL